MEDGPEFSDVGSKGDVRVKDNDFLQVRGKGLCEN